MVVPTATAVARRCTPWLCPRFPSSCPFRSDRGSVSSARHIARSVRISRTTRTCTLHTKGYGTYRLERLPSRLHRGAAVLQRESQRSVQPSPAPPLPAATSSVFALMYSLPLRSCRLMGAFVISPLPSFLIKTACAVRPLRSTGITPLLRYCGPSRHRLVFPRFPGFAGYTRYLTPTDFPLGRGRFHQLLSMSLSPCCPYYPAEVTRRVGQFATCHAAFARP